MTHVATLLGSQQVLAESKYKVFKGEAFLCCALVPAYTHLVDADNGEMIASSLVFSVHVKVYGLLKWELVRISHSTKGVMACGLAAHSRKNQSLFLCVVGIGF